MDILLGLERFRMNLVERWNPVVPLKQGRRRPDAVNRVLYIFQTGPITG